MKLIVIWKELWNVSCSIYRFLASSFPHPPSRLPSPSAQADGGQVGHLLPQGEKGIIKGAFAGRDEIKKRSCERCFFVIQPDNSRPETAHRLGFVVEDFEDGVQLGDLKQVANPCGWTQKFQLAAMVGDGREGRDQLGDS